MNLRSRNAGLVWRGGRAVDCAGLENRKAERSREFESHPLRSLKTLFVLLLLLILFKLLSRTVPMVIGDPWVA